MKNNNKKPLENSRQVIVRFAPSPTGYLHIGGVRTALFNYLFARGNGGKFILRLEDTDTERNKYEYEVSIYDGLRWLGLKWDEEYKQSERSEIYKQHIKKLIDSNLAFVSKENTLGKREEVIRFRNPNKELTFHDVIRGGVSFDTTELGDFVIARSESEPLYHLAAVIDDYKMAVTHVIRGEDHISNTPRQILIQEALGAPRPVYAHIPLILGSDRSKLSKRHGAVSVIEYRDRGYLPEALVNYLALLGWNPGTDKEIFTLDELVNEFTIERIQKGGAIFDEEKLKWINSEHKKKSGERAVIVDLEKTAKIIFGNESEARQSSVIGALNVSGAQYSTVADQINYIKEVQEINQINTTDQLVWKSEKDSSNTIRHLQWAIEKLGNIPEDKWKYEEIKSIFLPYADSEGRGAVLWPIRFALSGKDKSPDPFILAVIHGKKKTIELLKSALKLLRNE